MDMTAEQLSGKIETLTAKASELVEGLSSDTSADQVKAVRDEVDLLTTQVQPLIMEQQRLAGEQQVKAITNRVNELSEAVRSAQERARLPEFTDFSAGRDEGGSAYFDGNRSLFKDIATAGSGGKSAREAAERLETFFGEGGKAHTEGSDAAGGYLVRPQYLGLLGTRERLPGALEGIVPSVNVQTDAVEFVRQGNGLSAGWVAELAAKPAGADLGFTTFSANIFTVAGLALASNQLLEDSSIDRLLITQLGRRIGNVVEAGILSGTGSGQPLGILNTSGVQSQVYTDASPTVGELLGSIALAISKVQDNAFSEPTHIVMRPQTWTAIITSNDGAGNFTYGHTASDPSKRQATESLNVSRTIFGVPVVVTGNMPSNLGAGTNETRIIVGDFSEALLLNRSGIAVDKSEHVYFTTNQTLFRAERRVGFTAGRYPESFAVISGTGLINTSF